jgi:hypothetical protein
MMAGRCADAARERITMTKRLLFFAALATLWAAPTDSRAGSFGLTYSRQCSSCSFCVRPYNAFSSVTCGVASTCGPSGCGSGCGWGGCGAKGWNNFGPKCCGFGGGCGFGGCGWGCRKHGCCGRKIFCHRLRGRLFGCKNYPIFPEDYEGEEGAFGGIGQEVAFFGQPAMRNGYNPGCSMGWMYNTPGVNIPGHTPPPGPCVQPYGAACTNVWVAPQPFPGMYGIPYQYAPPFQLPYRQTPEQGYGHYHKGGPVSPVSYQDYGSQGGYWWYPGYDGQSYQGWYVPANYYQWQGQ